MEILEDGVRLGDPVGDVDLGAVELAAASEHRRDRLERHAAVDGLGRPSAPAPLL